jgi:cytochrome c
VKLVWLALAAAVSSIGVARAQTPQILLQQYKCDICHANDESKTGPAYAAVATRYRANPQAVAILTAAIRGGAHGSGPWHMPPHPEVSDADARKMVRYILSLKK